MTHILIRQRICHVRKLRAQAAAEGVSAEEEARRTSRRFLVGDVPSMPLIDFCAQCQMWMTTVSFEGETRAAKIAAMNVSCSTLNVVSELRTGRVAPQGKCLGSDGSEESKISSACSWLGIDALSNFKSRANPHGRSAGEVDCAAPHLYAERILPVTLEIAPGVGPAECSAADSAGRRSAAATALVHRLTFVTRNVKNVEGLGVSLLNPWS